ncbi:MAG: hypothetical protein ACT443_04045, partial [Gemmatimonadota bacterium]
SWKRTERAGHFPAGRTDVEFGMRRFIAIATIALAACSAKQQPAPAALGAAESRIEVCVVDTIAPGGMMTLGAMRVHATGDTLVLQSEGRVPLRTIVQGPKVLSEATWITARAPLQLRAASGRVRFAKSGEPRVMAPGSIVLLGIMRGLPLYALPAEGAALRPELEALAARGVDLEKALQQRLTLRRQLDRVRTLYLPTALAGCSFQGFTKARRR